VKFHVLNQSYLAYVWPTSTTSAPRHVHRICCRRSISVWLASMHTMLDRPSVCVINPHYRINAQTYVLKLAKSGADGEKVFLLLESGARFHTVQVRDLTF
jgi:hypothetical protein